MATYEDLPKLMRKGLEGSLRPEQLEEYKTNPTWMEALAESGERIRISLDILEAIAHEEEDEIPWGHQIEALQHVLLAILKQKRIEDKDKQEVVAYLLFWLMGHYPIVRLPKLVNKLAKDVYKVLEMADTWTEQTRQGTAVLKNLLDEDKPADTVPKMLRKRMKTMTKEQKHELNIAEESRHVKKSLATLKAIADEEEDAIPWLGQVSAIYKVLYCVLDQQPNKTKDKRMVLETLYMWTTASLVAQWSSKKDEDQFFERVQKLCSEVAKDEEQIDSGTAILKDLLGEDESPR